MSAHWPPLTYTPGGYAERDATLRQVRRALALERDRHDAEIAELREDVAGLGVTVARLAALLQDEAAHSVKAGTAPAASEGVQE